jgi:hypothetical protein
MMAISSREKNILLLAAAVALVFFVSSISPTIAALYRDRAANIDSVSLDIEREQRLIAETDRWQERRQAAQQSQAELEKQIFSGGTIPVVEANIQRNLSADARDSGITVNSTRLAERLETDGWLLISQEMSFSTTNAANTISFLQKLEESQPRMRVTDFSINRSRNQYSGSITVVGFARSPSALAQAGEAQ